MKSKSSSRKRALTAEEADLWASAMRDAKQLRRREALTEKGGEAAARDEDAGSVPPAKSHHVNGEPKTLDGLQQKTGEKPGLPPLAQFDDRQRRRIARNIETIDARIDLHGMRQREAHTALRSFLFASAARGERNVLVITGKGTRAEIERSRDYLAEERGVLRRLVPQWLDEPEFRAVVLSYTTASVRHGGEGALYVRLRKLTHHHR